MELTQLWRYPVKSCGGIALARADVDDYGIVDDRLFAVVHEEGGRLLTQRTVPRLNLISVAASDNELRMSAPSMPDLVVDRRQSYASASVQLWDVAAPGVCMGATTAQWFSEFLKMPCRLVQSRELFGRQMPAPAQHLFLTEQLRYPDCSPVLLTSQTSLDDLNARANARVEMAQFRPNLVIDGLEPYAEDRFRTVRIGDVVLDYMGPCERCGITLIVPGTERRGVEPLKTLQTYRFRPQRLESGLVFGAYFQPRNRGVLQRGARVSIESRGESLDIRAV